MFCFEHFAAFLDCKLQSVLEELQLQEKLKIHLSYRGTKNTLLAQCWKALSFPCFSPSCFWEVCVSARWMLFLGCVSMDSPREWYETAVSKYINFVQELSISAFSHRRFSTNKCCIHRHLFVFLLFINMNS